MLLQFLNGTIRSGFRGRSFQLVLLLGVMLVGVAYLAASFSPRQPKTVALDIGLSMVRFSMVLLSLLWVQEMVGREVDRRTVIFSLTYPVPRSTYLIGRYFGVLLLVAFALLVLALLQLIAVLFAGGSFAQEFPVSLGGSYWLSIIGIWLDVAVVAAFAVFVSSISTTPMLPLGLGLAFAISARSLGAVREYLLRGAGGDKAIAENFTSLVNLIGWVVPDLSRLDWRVAPMYGVPMDVTGQIYAVAMAVIYSGLLLMLAVRMFARREFS